MSIEITNKRSKNFPGSPTKKIVIFYDEQSWRCFKCKNDTKQIVCECGNHSLELKNLYPNKANYQTKKVLSSAKDQFDLLLEMNHNLKFYLNAKNTYFNLKNYVIDFDDLKDGKWWFDTLKCYGQLDIDALEKLQVYLPKIKNFSHKNVMDEKCLNALLIRCPKKESIVGLHVIKASSLSVTCKEIIKAVPDTITNSSETSKFTDKDENQSSLESNSSIDTVRKLKHLCKSKNTHLKNGIQLTNPKAKNFFDVVLNCNMGFCTQLISEETNRAPKVNLNQTEKAVEWIKDFFNDGKQENSDDHQINFNLINASGLNGNSDLKKILFENPIASERNKEFFNKIFHVRHPSSSKYNSLSTNFSHDMDIVFSLFKLFHNQIKNNETEMFAKKHGECYEFFTKDFDLKNLSYECVRCKNKIKRNEPFLTLYKYNYLINAIHIEFCKKGQKVTKSEENIFFFCPACRTCFNNHDIFEFHKLFFHKKVSYECLLCGKQSKAEERLKHLKEHNKNNEYNIVITKKMDLDKYFATEDIKDLFGKKKR